MPVGRRARGSAAGLAFVRVRSGPDLVAGLLFSALGMAVAIGASRYRLGTAANVGPGYFPTLLGYVLALLGSAVALNSFRAADRSEGPRLSVRALVIIVGSVLAFAAALPRLGLVLTVFLVTVLSSTASPGFSLHRAVAIGIGLAAACYGIFVLGLGLRIPAWPALRL